MWASRTPAPTRLAFFSSTASESSSAATRVTLWWNAAIRWTLAVEALVLAAVLAIEGVREYRLYRSAFTAWNAQLPPSGSEM